MALVAGSIRRRGKQSWEICAFACKDAETGKKRYVTRTVHGDRREAEVALGRLLGEIDDGQHAVRAGTVGELCDALLALIVREVRWRGTDTGAPPTEHDISWAWHRTTNLLRALNLLSTGGGWQDRSYGITPAGRAA